MIYSLYDISFTNIDQEGRLNDFNMGCRRKGTSEHLFINTVLNLFEKGTYSLCDISVYDAKNCLGINVDT